MFKSVVKVCGSTVKLQLILDVLSAVEAGGIRGVAVHGAMVLGGMSGISACSMGSLLPIC